MYKIETWKKYILNSILFRCKQCFGFFFRPQLWQLRRCWRKFAVPAEAKASVLTHPLKFSSAFCRKVGQALKLLWVPSRLVSEENRCWFWKKKRNWCTNSDKPMPLVWFPHRAVGMPRPGQRGTHDVSTLNQLYWQSLLTQLYLLLCPVFFNLGVGTQRGVARN